MNAEERLKILLEEGSKAPCSHRVPKGLPEWFDSTQIQRGQTFFQDNIFPLIFSKYLGLIFTMSVKNMLHLLILTNKTSTAEKAYTRYARTIFHTLIWYEHSFEPDSKIWKSLRNVSSKHESASKSFSPITQKEMVLTQFAFIGFTIVFPERLGLKNITDENLDDLMHIWRTIGFILGIEDKFNLCSGTAQENKQFCLLIFEKYLRPQFLEIDQDFVRMATVATRGFKSFAPCMDYNATVALLMKICKIEDHNLNLKMDRGSRMALGVFLKLPAMYETIGPILNGYIRVMIFLNKLYLTLRTQKKYFVSFFK